MHSCKSCKYWHKSWADENSRNRGGCEQTRRSKHLIIVDNVGRTSAFGYLETPATFACKLYKHGKPVELPEID